MEEIEYRRLKDAEDDLWWFRARRRIIESLVNRLALAPDATVVDIGCGTGGNLEMLSRIHDAVGIEPSALAAELGREREGVRIVTARAEDTTLAAGAYDLVTMLDVLEHIDDEQVVLAEVRRILKPGGHLLLMVPAFMFLWCGHDVALHHRRRYRRPELHRILVDAGFDVPLLSYCNATLFPAVAAVRLLRRLIGGGEPIADGLRPLPWWTNDLLERVMASERHLLGRLNLPFGVSIVGLARA